MRNTSIMVAAVVGVSLLACPAFAQDKNVPPKAPSTDMYGGLTDVKGKAGDMFSVQKIGNRWWIVTPDGHGTFIRCLSKTDTNNRNVDCSGYGQYQAYDAVYIQPKDGQPSANLKDAAGDTLAKDVVDSKSGATLKDVGDAIIFGSERFVPSFTYFWLDTLGKGGTVQWYYSTSKDLPAGQAGWKLINGTGNPFFCEKKNADGSYSLDIGDYLGPDKTGYQNWGNKSANRIGWFDAAKAGLPADYAQTTLPNDSTPRYYIKGVVTKAFETAPVLNQMYQRPIFDETVQLKYGPGDWNTNWAKAVGERLKGWGFNAVGMYSGRYTIDAAPKLGDNRLPDEPTWVLGGAAMKDPKYLVKNVYSGAIFPPGSGQTGWHGVQPDMFDPMFEKAYVDQAAKELPKLSKWSWSLITEEADFLFGLNSLGHDHMGYVVLSQNPCRLKDTHDNIAYTDQKFYAKYAMRDFLRNRYKDAAEKLDPVTVDSKVPAYGYAAKPEGAELKALENLNKAWGTSYTTWGTSEGDMEKGTNAWAKGTGFMDENGAGILAKGMRDAAFSRTFTKPEFPAVRTDLDDFLGLSAARYGKGLAKACNQGKHPPLILPLYQGPDLVYKNIAPYVDGFWFSSGKPKEDALRIYNAGHKPVIVADYTVANPDSPLYFKSKIEKISYDAARKVTIVYGPDIRWKFRPPMFIEFPDSPDLAKAARDRGMTAAPRPSAVQWNTLEISGDYTPYVKVGQTVALYGAYRPPGASMPETQAQRAKLMTGNWESVLNLKGDDGNCFVMGFEHWSFTDDGVNNGSENDNYGIVTLLDNAYDGKEAVRAPGKDAQGRMVGGEEADYGNLLGPLSEYLRSIPSKISK